MQDQAVEFDPISINRTIPWGARLLVLYLLIMSVIWVLRSVSLLTQFWFFSHAKRRILRAVGDERA
jgi:hypothetical protein